MWPVPATKVKAQGVKGAPIGTYLGFGRMPRSAMRTRKSIPPAASITEAAMMTARMISITSIGGEVGFTPKTTIRISSPTAPHRPRPTPLERAPIQMAASTTTNCSTIEIVMSSPLGGASRGPGSLLELGADEVLEREHLVPLLLGEELPLLHDHVVQALARLVALLGDLAALLVAERGLEHRHDAQRIEHHVARALGVGGDALDAVHAEAGDRALHRRDRAEEREGDDRLHDVQLQLPGRGGEGHGEVEADHQEAGLVHDLGDHRIHLARHDRGAWLHLLQVVLVTSAMRTV